MNVVEALAFVRDFGMLTVSATLAKAITAAVKADALPSLRAGVPAKI